MSWQSIEEGFPHGFTQVDIVAKKWDPFSDGFYYGRFTDCTVNERERTIYCPKDWRITHWMAIPALPEVPA